MLEAVGWGAVAAGSLLLGALLALARPWGDRVVGVVLGFGAGALISGVAFELAEEGLRIGGAGWVAGGLALGALAFFLADRRVEARGGREGGASSGTPLAVGALLDGVPEQLVLGIGLARGDGVSLALLVAIFVSNLPEAVGASSDMRAAGRPPRFVLSLWAVVALVCTAATAAGFALSDLASGDVQAGIDGFAAGALLVMLVDSMVPEATRKARDVTGLATVVGFAVAAGLSLLS